MKTRCYLTLHILHLLNQHYFTGLDYSVISLYLYYGPSNVVKKQQGHVWTAHGESHKSYCVCKLTNY